MLAAAACESGFQQQGQAHPAQHEAGCGIPRSLALILF
jgi:hypothetical protein